MVHQAQSMGWREWRRNRVNTNVLCGLPWPDARLCSITQVDCTCKCMQNLLLAYTSSQIFAIYCYGKLNNVVDAFLPTDHIMAVVGVLWSVCPPPVNLPNQNHPPWVRSCELSLLLWYTFIWCYNWSICLHILTLILIVNHNQYAFAYSITQVDCTCKCMQIDWLLAYSSQIFAI